jgi:anti-sigma factor RsiW
MDHEAARGLPECRRIVGLLSDYLDGELGETDRWSVKLHLDACLGCTRLAAELAATVQALGRLAGVPCAGYRLPGSPPERS